MTLMLLSMRIKNPISEASDVCPKESLNSNPGHSGQRNACF